MQKVKKFRMVLVLLMLFSCLSLNVEAATSFSDVSDSAYYAPAVQWAVENNITNGMGDGTFGVNNTVTRAQAVTFLWRYKGQPSPTAKENPFIDVKDDDYSKDAILWAVEKNITEGMGDNKFEPDGSVTRGQMITFLWRSNGKPNDTGGAWYEAAENWANSKGILNGTSQKYSTDDACPRCDVVYYLYLDYIDKEADKIIQDIDDYINDRLSGGSESTNEDDITAGSGSGSGSNDSTGSNNGSTSSSQRTPEEEAKRAQLEQQLYGEYGGYEGYIDWLYNEYGGKYTREQLKKANPDMSWGGDTGGGGTSIH